MIGSSQHRLAGERDPITFDQRLRYQGTGPLAIGGTHPEMGHQTAVAHQKRLARLQLAKEMHHRPTRFDAVGGLEDEATHQGLTPTNG